MDTDVVILKSRRTMKQEAISASSLVVGTNTLNGHLKKIKEDIKNIEDLSLKEYQNNTNKKIEILEKEIELLQKQMDLLRLEYESSNLKEE